MPKNSKLLAWAAFVVSLYPLALLAMRLPTVMDILPPLTERAPLFTALATMFAVVLVATVIKPQRVITVVALLWLGLCLYVGGPPAALAFALWALAAAAVGSRILGPFDAIQGFERAAVCYLTGAAVLIALGSLVLQLPVHQPAAYAFVCVILCAWQRASLRELGRSIASQWRDFHSQPWPAPVGVLAVLTLVVGLFGALGTLTPIVAFDDLSFHLRLPYELLARHRYSFDISHQVWAVAPWASDYAFAIPFLIGQGNEGVKAWMAGTLELASAVLLLGLLRRRLADAPALLFLLSYLSIPLLLVANHTLHTEALSATLVMAIFALRFADERASVRAAIAASLMIGLLGAIKSSNLAACLGLGLLWLPIFVREARARPSVSVPIAIALLGAAIPYAFAWAKTGNPLFPLFNGIFKSPHFDPVNFSNSAYSGMFGSGLFASLFLDSTRFIETSLPFAGGLALFFLLPSAVIVVAARADAPHRWAMGIAMFYALIVLHSQQYLRYLLPVMGLATFAASTLWTAPTHSGVGATRLWRGWWIALVLVAVCINVPAMPRVFWQASVDNVWLSLTPFGRAAYLDKFAPERALNRAVNADMGVNATVLYTADPFGADLLGTPVYSTWYNPTAARAYAEVQNEADAAEFVRRMRITHVVPPKASLDLPSAAQASVRAMETYARNHGTILASTSGATVIALDDGIVWPRLLWKMDPAQAGQPITAKNALSVAVPVASGTAVLFEVRGTCDSLQARAAAAVLWQRGNTLLRSRPDWATCIPQPGQPNGAYVMRIRSEAPARADSVRIWIGGVNDTPVRVESAQLRTLAP